jgi:hypothetical protein
MGLLTLTRQLLNTPTRERFTEHAPEDPDAEYLALAKQAGVSVAVPPREKTQPLRKFLHEQSIPVYHSMRVHKYMCWTAYAQRKDWCWMFLTGNRNASPIWLQTREWKPSDSMFVDSVFNSGRGICGGINDGPYDKPIPKSVLRTMATIMTQYEHAQELAFYVSDYHAPRPDPFLAVGCGREPLLVIDYWHEPGFTP